MSQRTDDPTSPFSRPEVEDFLYEEAALLDEWRLSEWLSLFTEDATYSIPPTDAPNAEPDDTLFLVSDDAPRLRSRVEQLEGSSTWSENPRSRTRRMISNVRVVHVEADRARVSCNFVVYRMRNETTSTYVGRWEHVLVWNGERILIQDRRAILDLETLHDVGKISFIL
ncbi:MAG: aromatic-ring-hydroxylating dioxygenase subunit beta [Myxococcota bacterium]|nr:aromatic-ring-hydroxylating dioxygenase subunit beta [Myxococcota bacterium]